MNKLLLIISLVSANIYATHEPCIAIYPPPPECLHDDDDSDGKNILITGAVVAGVYFYLNKDKDMESFDINNGIAIYDGRRARVSFLSNRYNHFTENIYQPSAIHPLNSMENYHSHNIISIDFSLWTNRP